MTPNKAQYEAALEKANYVRVFRSELKHKIHAREVTVQSLLEEMPWEIQTMRVSDLLRAQPRWAHLKTASLLHKERMSDFLKVNQLTERQIGRLLSGLDEHWAQTDAYLAAKAARKRYGVAA